MASKRKPKKSQFIQKPSTHSSNNPQTVSLNWWNKPLFSRRSTHDRMELIGYGITALLVICLISYFLKGHSIRPRILDDGVIDRIVHPPENLLQSIRLFGPKDSNRRAKTEEGKEGLYMHINPGEFVGFFVPRDAVTIPDDARTVGVSISNAYKGCPSFNYGFTNTAMGNNEENIKKFLREATSARTEMIPSMDSMRYVFAMPHFCGPDTFDVPWNEAAYLYVFYTASVPTDLFLDKMVILEQ